MTNLWQYLQNPITRSVGLIFFTLGILFLGLLARLPEIKDSLALSKFQTGMVLWSISIGAMLGTLMSGQFLRRRTAGQGAFIGIILAAGAVNLPPLATVYPFLLGGFLLAGVTNALVNVAMNSIAASVEQTGGVKILSTCHGMFSLGGFLGAGISGLMNKWEISLVLHFGILATIMLILVLLHRKYLFAIADLPSEENDRVFVLPDRRTFWPGVVIFGTGILEGTMIDWSPVYFQDVLGAGPFWVSFSAGAVTGAMAFFRLSGDYLRTRLGETRLLRISALLTVCGVWLNVLVPLIPVAFLGNFIAGAGLATMVPIIYGLAARIPGASAKHAVAGMAAVSLMGFMTGPPVVGSIAELSNLRYGYVFAGVIALIALIATFQLPKIKA